jgi:signal transduction histidine kinase
LADELRQPLSVALGDGGGSPAFAVADAGQRLVVVLDAHDSVYVSADRLRLLQVVSNLLGNAVKYTPPSGRITMALERRAWTATLRITDTGRGIEARSEGVAHGSEFLIRLPLAGLSPGGVA